MSYGTFGSVPAMGLSSNADPFRFNQTDCKALMSQGIGDALMGYKGLPLDLIRNPYKEGTEAYVKYQKNAFTCYTTGRQTLSNYYSKRIPTSKWAMLLGGTFAAGWLGGYLVWKAIG
ncbi:MAG: hypothetical protein ACYTEQ_05135 [Planctomycetota bacterium]|jgi:hypothetical protein